MFNYHSVGNGVKAPSCRIHGRREEKLAQPPWNTVACTSVQMKFVTQKVQS